MASLLPVNLKNPQIKEAYDFWNQWLTKSGNYQRTTEEIEICSNANIVYEAAFRAYITLLNTSYDHWFLNVNCDENDKIIVHAASKDALVLQNETMRNWVQSEINPKYFLLVLRRKNVMFVFRKWHNWVPYAIMNEDIKPVIEFRKLCGDYKFASRILKDDDEKNV
jgi:hypothetical protein